MTISQLTAIIPDDARNKGMLAALGGNLLISFDSVFIRLSGTGGVNTAFLFGLFTAISMAVILQATDKRGLTGTLKESGWPAVLAGLIMLGSASTFVLSVKHTVVANTVIIMSGQPVLTAVFSWFFLKEETPKALWLTITAVLGGIFIVVSGSLESGNILGDSLALITVVCLALNGTLLRRYREISRMAIVGLGGFFTAAAMFFPATPESFTLNTWLIMGAMGLASAPFGRVLNALSSRYIRAAETAMIALVKTVFAPIWVFILFGEQPPFTTLVGGAVILTAISVYILAGKRS